MIRTVRRIQLLAPASVALLIGVDAAVMVTAVADPPGTATDETGWATAATVTTAAIATSRVTVAGAINCTLRTVEIISTPTRPAGAPAAPRPTCRTSWPAGTPP